MSSPWCRGRGAWCAAALLHVLSAFPALCAPPATRSHQPCHTSSLHHARYTLYGLWSSYYLYYLLFSVFRVFPIPGAPKTCQPHLMCAVHTPSSTHPPPPSKGRPHAPPPRSARKILSTVECAKKARGSKALQGRKKWHQASVISDASGSRKQAKATAGRKMGALADSLSLSVLG